MSHHLDVSTHYPRINVPPNWQLVVQAPPNVTVRDYLHLFISRIISDLGIIRARDIAPRPLDDSRLRYTFVIGMTEEQRARVIAALGNHGYTVESASPVMTVITDGDLERAG